MKKISILIASISLIATTAHAAYEVPAPVPHWQILPDKSRVEWFVNYSGHELAGVFPEITGSILFDPTRLLGTRMGFKIPTGKVKSNDKDAQDYLPTHDWLDSDEYPVAQFTADPASLKFLGGNQYTMAGKLMIHGRETEITLPFTLALSTNRDTWTPTVIAVADASVVLKRLDFNVGTGDWADTSALSNDVKVHVHIEARKLQ